MAPELKHPSAPVSAPTEPATAQLTIAEPAREPQSDAGPDGSRRERSPVAELLEIHSRERQAHAERVSSLFPRPETTEWNVRELSYQRSRAGANS